MTRTEPQSHPDRPAGQPEDDQARRVLLDRLLGERFPGMHRRPARLTPTTGPGSVLPVPTTNTRRTP